jgi:CRISPR-associated protein Csx10
MRSGYVTNSTYSTLPKGVTTHNTVDDQEQRPNENGGGVYSYESISSQTKFRAKIHIQHQLVSQATAESCLGALVGSQNQIGRSKKDSYGLVEITAIETISKTQTQFSPTSELRVWLLSDVLMRNSRLRPSIDPSDFAHVLEDRLKVKLSFKSDHISALARSRRTDSWQTRWGLPRPSLVGLVAGSCFLFTVEGEIDQNHLADLERSGIGERTAEGYGQICFNAPLIMAENPSLAESNITKNVDLPSILIDGQQPQQILDYAHIIEKEAWREEIRRRSVSLASDPVKRQELLGITISNSTKEKSQPSMSQLGVLRTIMMTSINSDPHQNSLVSNWIDELPLNIQKKWPDGSLEKIRDLLTTSERLWSFLADLPPTITDIGIQNLQRELWQETVQILVMNCIRAHKRDLEPEDQ